jgi:V/A-type H+-transporting ATPase subunit I
VQLKNSWFARLFEPISRLFSLPDYAELDLTAYFAPFFMLFFGFCVGDAGYGLIILLGCTLGKRFVSPDVKGTLPLASFSVFLQPSWVLFSGLFLVWSWLKFLLSHR